MPTYVFTCDDPKSPYHEQPLEELISLQEYEATKDKKVCPITNSPLRRLWMDGGENRLIFKGSGFYCNDSILNND